MKILISADIEGVAGVFHSQQTRAGNSEYEHARLLMTNEVNAAVKGCFDGGATEVFINDSHGRFRNLLPDLIDSRAKIIQGKPRYLSMCSGIELHPDALFFIGHHAKSKSAGILAHTINGKAFSRIWINDIELGEVGLYSALAAEFDVPIALVSGDDVLVQETRLFLPNITYVQTKQAENQYAGCSLQPKASCDAIYQACRQTVIDRLSQAMCHQILGPYTCRLQTQTPALATLFAQWPTVVLDSPDCVSFTQESIQDVIRVLNCFSAMSFMLAD